MDVRNEDLEGIPGWSMEHELADKPAPHANLTRPFLHWFLLRRARQRAAHRRHPVSADRGLRRRVSVALDFLAWMDQRGLALADLAQEHIGDWIAGTTGQRRYLIRYFLKWTASRRLTREMTVPLHPEPGVPGPARRRSLATPPTLPDRRRPAHGRPRRRRDHPTVRSVH
ncbi:hypothetical protein [Streptomyces sp. NPDC014622]|uniref:hypothetical protein n=1 Tax=Streptomyces sp. NPDC014622 TaxID=3364874 RepID=UPI0036F866FE